MENDSGLHRSCLLPLTCGLLGAYSVYLPRTFLEGFSRVPNACEAREGNNFSLFLFILGKFQILGSSPYAFRVSSNHLCGNQMRLITLSAESCCSGTLTGSVE